MNKRFIIFAGILILRLPAFAQPCLPLGITFNTQNQIDSFQINHPGCSEIQGSLYITGTNITNLNGLTSVTHVGADLYIRNTTVLANLTGLDNLTSVGNEVSIGGNAMLNSLEGLGGLESTGYALELDLNPSLTTLSGLNSLAFIGGYLKITDNVSLVSLSGLESLFEVSGAVNIGNNPLPGSLNGLNNLHVIGGGLIVSQNSSLASLEGLNNLSMLTGGLSIGQNPAFISFESLSSLTGIGGSLWIYDNDALHSLTGLDNITAYSIMDLTLSENDSLSSCDVMSICNYLSNPNGNVVVQNNFAGCNDTSEIESACQAILIQEMELSTGFLTWPNPAGHILSIPPDYAGKIMAVNFYHTNGFKQLNVKPISGCLDVSRLPDGLYIVEFVFHGSVIRKKLVIQ